MPETFPSADNNFMEVPQRREIPDAERDDSAPKTRAEQIVREETNKLMPEMHRRVTKGLNDLFELLPQQGKAKKEEIVSLIAQTDLALMLPAMREKFAREMVRKKVNQAKDKAEFIAQALETDAIKMFMHLEALKGSTEAAIARLREERENQRGRQTEERAQSDAARLAELRKEILGDQDDDVDNVAEPLSEGSNRQGIDESGGRNPAL